MKLAVTHRNSSSLKVANNTIISYFSLLLLLGLAQFHDRKPIFRGALCNNRTLSTLSLSIPHRSRASPPIRVTITPATQPGTEKEPTGVSALLQQTWF